MIGIQADAIVNDHVYIPVHGLAVKASGGVRYGLNDRTAVHVAVGRIEARSSAGNRFTAGTVGVGLDYRFSMPG
ncbi:MAG: hypothetical protein ABI574_13770 [Burkholderiales bacterium]